MNRRSALKTLAAVVVAPWRAAARPVDRFERQITEILRPAVEKVAAWNRNPEWVISIFHLREIPDNSPPELT